MKKGIVLEIHNKFVTVLTPEGEFLKARRQHRHYEIGSEITFTPFRPKKRNAASFFYYPKKVSVICSLAGLILILSILPGRFHEEVCAYMTIDVNPSIELALDDRLQVVNLKGLNPEGEEVIEHLSVRNKEMKVIAEEIVNTTEKLGYFHNQKKIVVSTTLMEKNDKLAKELTKQAADLSKTAALVPKATVKIVNATEKDRNNAKQEGISTGKYIEKKKAIQQKTNIEKERAPVTNHQKKGVASKAEKKAEKKASKPAPQKQPPNPRDKKTGSGNKGNKHTTFIPNNRKPHRPKTDQIKKPVAPIVEKHKNILPDKNSPKDKWKEKGNRNNKNNNNNNQQKKHGKTPSRDIEKDKVKLPKKPDLNIRKS